MNRCYFNTFLGTLGLVAVLCVVSCQNTKESTPESLPEAPEIDEEVAEQLHELGYADWVPAKDLSKQGVTLHKVDKAWSGVNLYSSLDSFAAFLVDMDGKEIHRWNDAALKTGKRGQIDAGWPFVRLMPNGDLIALVRDHSISRYSWEGELLWRTNVLCHHDFNFDPEGNIYVLSRSLAQKEFKGTKVPIVANGIAVLSPEGKLLRNTSIEPIFWDQVPRRRLRRLKAAIDKYTTRHKGGWNKLQDYDALPQHIRRLGDVFHTNTVMYMPRDVEGLCPKGSFIVSVRDLHRVACIDLEKGKELWSWGPGDLYRQHHPTLLANDHLLIFDNGRKKSRVLELDPQKKSIEWEYKSPEFFTSSRGSSQMLQNGTILVTESNTGRAFEINRNGEVVWEFFNPHTYRKKRGGIYRFFRYPAHYTKL